MMPGIRNTDIQKLTARIAYPILKKKLFDMAEGEGAGMERTKDRRPRGMDRFWRGAIYAAGMISLAIGLTLYTKTGLGVSPVVSVSFSITEIWGINYALSTFGVYMLFLAVQLLLKGKARRPGDLLQIPFSLVFGLLLDWFSLVQIRFYTLWQNLLLLLAAMAFTAVGMSMMVDMRLVLSPADGLADTIGKCTGRGVGFGKNIVDLSCVVVTCAVSYLFSGRITAIGLGTLIAMICVGRLAALFQLLFYEPLLRRAGLPEAHRCGASEQLAEESA